MRRPARRPRLQCLLPILLLTLLFAPGAWAGVQLKVSGLQDPLQAAVVSQLDLSQYADRSVTAAQIRRLYEAAPEQVRQTLQPYGYYDATVDGDLRRVGKDWLVTLRVQPGPPVKITSVDVSLGKQALAVKDIRQAKRAVEKLKGNQLNDGEYRSARDAVGAALTAHGFLSARLVTHRVAVTLADHTAAVELAWQTGPRYRFGQVHFDNSQLEEGFLQRYVPFKAGDYFSQQDLLDLQQALNGADYFSVVNVLPDIEGARDGIVDVQVQLKPAPRSIYTGGPFIGTDTGFGVRAGVQRRWVNRRGHKWSTDLVLAQRLKTLSTQYTIPLPGKNQRSLNFGANYRDANTASSQSRTLELVANETRQWHGWTRILGAHALAGTFTVGRRGNEPSDAPGIEHGRSTLVFAEGSLSRKQADNLNFVRHGWSVNLYARSTVASVLSDTAFTQVAGDVKWIDAFTRRDRLILRGSVGATWTSDFSALPPQLRFFAGGDRSVRGYGYQAIGPRNAYDRVIGGRNLLVASTELEHYFTHDWGMAAFVDAGNAFNGTDYRPRIGAGLGVRWLSPVGMVRLDVGVPVHNPDAHGFQLHLVIGPDL